MAAVTPPTAYLPGAIQKAAAIDRSVNVRVEQDEQILIEVIGGLAFHVPSQRSSVRLQADGTPP